MVGANAAGKSNFVSIFQFLRDIFDYDLENAISMQGGIEYLMNMRLRKTKDTVLQVLLDHHVRLPIDNKLNLRTNEMDYCLTLKHTSRGFKILETAKLRCDYFQVVSNGKESEEERLGSGEVVITNLNGTVKYSADRYEGTFPEKKKIGSRLFPLGTVPKLPKNVLIIKSLWSLFLPFSEIFGEISIYDFDAKLPKKATPITGTIELEEDGNNLALVLRKVLKNGKSRKQFLNLMQDTLPFVGQVKVSKFADRSFLFSLQESYHGRRYLPASVLSDGTISITAIVLALYFESPEHRFTEEETVTIIEEPERNIHPSLISRIVDMMRDVSDEKQILLTTHNPEIVKYAGIENLRFIFRDEEGFTGIFEPQDNKHVQTFLSQELGIDYVYKQNLWRPRDAS